MQLHTTHHPRTYALLAALLVLLLSAACTQTPLAPAASQGISAQNVWARPAKTMGNMPMEGDTQQMQHGGANSAVYMVLANGGATTDRLVAAQADVSNAIEIHETTMEGDVMRMQQVEGGIEVPAGGQVELRPGGLHVMLIGLTRDLNVGEKFPMTLQFASGNSLVVEAEVRQP
jgi:periplasmic copper chaperone A